MSEYPPVSNSSSGMPGADLEVRTEEDNTEQLNITISEAGLTKAELNRN